MAGSDEEIMQGGKKPHNDTHGIYQSHRNQFYRAPDSKLGIIQTKNTDIRQKCN